MNKCFYNLLLFTQVTKYLFKIQRAIQDDLVGRIWPSDLEFDTYGLEYGL